MELLKRNWTLVVGAFVGAAGGYLYWAYVGCASGACPITSSPVISTVYGAVLGSLLGGLFKGVNIKKEK